MTTPCEVFCGPNPSCISTCTRLLNISESVASVSESDLQDTIQGFILYDVIFDYVPIMILSIVIVLIFYVLGYFGGATTFVLIIFIIGLFALAAVLKNNLTVNYLNKRATQTRQDINNAIQSGLMNNPPV
jgi:Na+/H+ antiporter NhaC